MQRLKCGAGGLAALVAALSMGAAVARSEELSVAVKNHSEPVLCAENDNVYLSLESPAVRSLQVQAVHPAYIGTLVADRTAPDWTRCDIDVQSSGHAKVRSVTLFETPDLQLVGLVYPSFWRPARVPVRVGDKTVEGLHLLQLWVRRDERAEEVLVVYPPDGYWRARPMAPTHMRWTAYGSSFLVGPVEVAERPLVALKDITFEPATKTFHLAFASGGGARLRLSALDPDRIVLDVTFDRAVAGAPFAALRSMYVTESNNDVARLAWRAPGGRGWQESAIMHFEGTETVEFWAGRVVPSRHNTSAPDMIFGRFRAAEGR